MGLHLVPRRYKVLVSVARTGPGTPGAHFGGKCRGAEGSGIQQFHAMTEDTKAVAWGSEKSSKSIPNQPQQSNIDLNWAQQRRDGSKIDLKMASK